MLPARREFVPYIIYYRSAKTFYHNINPFATDDNTLISICSRHHHVGSIEEEFHDFVVILKSTLQDYYEFVKKRLLVRVCGTLTHDCVYIFTQKNAKVLN